MVLGRMKWQEEHPEAEQVPSEEEGKFSIERELLKKNFSLQSQIGLIFIDVAYALDGLRSSFGDPFRNHAIIIAWLRHLVNSFLNSKPYHIRLFSEDTL